MFVLYQKKEKQEKYQDQKFNSFKNSCEVQLFIQSDKKKDKSIIIKNNSTLPFASLTINKKLKL